MNFNEELKKLIDERKKTRFTAEYLPFAKEYETLGALVSNYFEWNGSEIVTCFLESLEDSNFHTLKAEIEELKEVKSLIKE